MHYTVAMELATHRRLVIDITLNNQYTGHFGIDTRLFLEKKVGESARHVAMKLLSWMALYRPGLEIEKSIGEHYKPDLVRVTRAGDVTHWIDCGQTSLTKLKTIVARYRDTEFTIVKSKPSELRHYFREAISRESSLESVQYLAFEIPAIHDICTRLHKRHSITVTVGGGLNVMYLDIDGEDLEVRFFRQGYWRGLV